MFSQDRRTIAFVIALVIILTSISVSTSSVGLPRLRRETFQLSSEVWYDDFENVTETLSEWTFDGWDTPNVTLSDGLLYSSGPDRNFMSHNSTTAIGTWSLDLFFIDQTDYWVWIVFMSPQWFDLHFVIPGYTATISQRGSESHIFRLAYIYTDPAGAFPVDIDEVEFDPASGWLHMDVTRQLDQWMYVYLNGIMILQGRDSRHDTSEYFRLVSPDNVMFDNITVSDTIDIDRVPPHWTEPLINHTINYGEDFSHAFSAYDSSGLDSWWINDTWLFELSDEHIVTSVVPLQVGNYGVEVYVNDTFGNVLSGAINVEVLSLPTNTTTPTGTSTGPDLLDPLRISLFGAIGVVWVVIVLFIFRDYRNQRNA